MEGPLNNIEGTYSTDPSLRKKKLLIILLIILIIVALVLILYFIISKISSKKSDNNDSELPKPLYIFPEAGYHTQTLIFIPGLSNTPEDFVNFINNTITIPNKNTTKIVLLRSPIVPTSYDGSKNYSWFDIYNIPINTSSSYNFEDAKKSAKIIENIIEEEVKLLNGSYNRIILGGHSQGGCLSLHIAYTTNYNLGAIIDCNGILFPQTEIVENKENLNVFIAHGGADPIIPIEFRNKTMERIMNYSGVKSYYYPNEGHAIETQERLDISSFLEEVIGKW